MYVEFFCSKKYALVLKILRTIIIYIYLKRFIHFPNNMWIPSCQSINAIEKILHFARVIVTILYYFETVDTGEYLQNHLIWYAYITIIIRFNLYYSWRSITLSILTRRVIQAYDISILLLLNGSHPAAHRYICT